MEEISEGFVFDGGVSIMTWHTLGTVPYKPEEVLNGVYINVTHWEFNLSSWRPNFFHTPLAGVHIYRFITQMLHVWNIGLHQKNTWPHSRGNGIVLFKPSMLFVPWPRLRWKISTVALQPEELQVQKGWTSKCYCWNLGCENPAQVAPSCHSRWPFWRHWWGIRHYGYSTSKIAEIVEIDDELRKIEEFIEPNEDGEYHFEDLFLGTWDEDKDSAIKISLKETFGKHVFCLTVPSTTTLDELKQSITEHFHLVRQLGLLIASNSSLAARLWPMKLSPSRTSPQLTFAWLSWALGFSFVVVARKSSNILWRQRQQRQQPWMTRTSTSSRSWRLLRFRASIPYMEHLCKSPNISGT